ncbi:MAG TPA: transketolase C-terminal domain-containing protein [Selenomonadales bacterium]|nr:transketolase C-terminal domain-containing protein [Selenomonadales bacterium]
MSTRVMLDGNGAASEGLRLARVKVIAAYPITPQSPISEKLADFVAQGKLDAKYIRVESEHSAMSCAIGAQLTGVRAGTATSSVGLALMHEVLGVAAGCRVPVVMPVVNRSLVSPWSLWCDHQDTMAERDGGWMQLFAESAQEVLDLILIAYRAAEDERLQVPAMVCLDGFFLSHMSDSVSLPDQAAVDAYLPPYRCHNFHLDPDDPMFINNLVPSAEFTEMRYQQEVAFKKAPQVLAEAMGEFKKAFGREYSLIQAYRCDDAEAVIVTLGSQSGTAKYAVDQLRKQGTKAGVLKLTSFRPFPAEEIQKALANAPVVGVMDRSAGFGAQVGPLATEVRAALGGKPVQGFIAGLGGRDVSVDTFEKAFARLLNKEVASGAEWLDVRPDALTLREVF